MYFNAEDFKTSNKFLSGTVLVYLRTMKTESIYKGNRGEGHIKDADEY